MEYFVAKLNLNNNILCTYIYVVALNTYMLIHTHIHIYVFSTFIYIDIYYRNNQCLNYFN